MFCCFCANGPVAQTMYKDPARENKGILVDELFGVAIACIYDDEVIWETPIDYKKRHEATQQKGELTHDANVCWCPPMMLIKPGEQ